MSARPRLLVAGIGNIFLGDDGFGVEVVQRLAQRPTVPEVKVADFGIRGIDLTYALLDGYDGAILVDAATRGGAPGTLYVIEPEVGPESGVPESPFIEAHSLDPARVLSIVRSLGGQLGALRVVGCEPLSLGSVEEPAMGLSAPVAAAVEPAICMVQAMIQELLEVGHA